MKIFGGFFSKKRRSNNFQQSNIVRKVEENEITIIPNFSVSSKITLDEDEVDKIGHIICEEKKNTSQSVGYKIAERIGKEVNPEKIRSMDVVGDESGISWIIKISDCPF